MTVTSTVTGWPAVIVAIAVEPVRNRWRRLGLDLEFRVDRSCSPSKLRGRASWCAATIYTARWRTKKGLRVGDTASRLRSLYPHAKFSDVPPNTWTLTREGRLTAEARGGAVVALHVFGTCS